MKRLLLIPALMFGTLSMATDYNYEITPLIGYNIAEGNIDLDDYAVFGAELQYNNYDSVIKPELSIFYSNADYNPGSADTDVWRVAVNGVYEYDKVGSIIPLAKVGLGYEHMSDPYKSATGNTNSPFLDAGVGAKIPFNDMMALKLEAIYMLKYNDARYDNNLIITAGLNIAFGEKAQKSAPVTTEPEPTPQPKEEPAPVVAAAPVVVDGDDDKDGVLNSVDKCPTTPAGVEVDARGCKVDNDIDKDGVLNAQDICPATPFGEAVNSDGCPATITLDIKFENNSAEIAPVSSVLIEKYANFLTTYNNYSAKIVGHTDSRGREAYNQKLSERRAKSVVNALIEKGVNPKQLSSLGEGESNPIADNATSEGRAENRRIEAELTRN
ncbi:MAG: cell envelope biogenesis protein OmpA [Epsilonproteobacteria bacterium]|nr:MAG: cell envelope biogenesis protein OmpA [Campylobacterota bacterium]